MTTPPTGPRRSDVFSRVPAETRRLVLKALALRPFGVAESESLMQFAPLGSLTCVCLTRNSGKEPSDRREVCRLCGGLPVPVAAEVLDRQGSAEEIHAHVETLRLACIRARGLEIPASVRNVQELHAYLDDYSTKRGRKPPRRPNAPVALVRQSTAQAGSRIA